MLTALGERIWWLDLGGVNAYLVDDGGEVTLVDAGPPWRSGAVLDALVEADYALTDLDRVLITHYDADHVAGLAKLGGFDIEVYAGRADAPFVAGCESPSMDSWKGFTQALMSPLVGSCPHEVTPVDDGDRVGSFTVYETPGHTPGHVAYVSESLDVAFLGDLVRESNGRLELAPRVISRDTDEMAASVRSLAGRAPEFAIAGAGHGVPFERGGSRRLRELADRL
jgi:glyoxylase-like metal-dependent hydrolase (beta-lactamase superfamily II)